MVSDGSSSLSIVPSVALMMPAPIRTMSGVPGMVVWGMCSLLSASYACVDFATNGTLTPGARMT